MARFDRRDRAPQEVKDVDRRSLLALALYQLLASNRSGLFSVYLVLYLVQRGASVPQALAIFSAAYVVASLTGPAAGRWSDRVGKRRPFLLFAEASSLPFFVVIPWIGSFWVAGLVFVVAETLLAVGSPALTASGADLTTASRSVSSQGLEMKRKISERLMASWMAFWSAWPVSITRWVSGKLHRTCPPVSCWNRITRIRSILQPLSGTSCREPVTLR